MFKSGRLTLLLLLCAGTGLALAGCQPSDSVQPAAHQARAAVPKTLVRGHIEFVQGYSDGFQMAQQAGKPMLVFFTASWCNFCHQMEAESFTNAEVAALSRQFVCILIDADLQPNVCEEFRVRKYPTIQFLSARGVPLTRTTGKLTPQQLTTHMQAALTAALTRESQTILR